MITLLLIGVIALLLISATVAPLESLGWWAGWFGEDAASGPDRGHLFDREEPASGERGDHYLVYLSGVASFTGSSIPREELPLLDALAANLPGTVLINDVFPYSVNNIGLTGERSLAWLWRKIEARRFVNPQAIWLYFVVIRNLFQVAVSADNRYGPIYNLGVATEIWRSLLRHGYRPDSPTPVTLIGTSGGSQVAIGAVAYLAAVIDAPIRVISLGGVMAADPGLEQVDHLYHLYGAKDLTHRLGPLLFPGRWPIAVNSPWRRAEAAGKITFIELGPFNHTGAGSPFDQASALPDGRTHFAKTLEVLTGLISDFYPVDAVNSQGDQQAEV